MSRLPDTLIKQLTEQRLPHAYSHEVKAMAQEILERRAAEAQLTQSQNSTAYTGLPWPPGGTYP